MSNKTYPTGQFSYPVYRPNIKALEAFRGKDIRKTSTMVEYLEHISAFARAINPKARVLWRDNIQTDHSVTNKDGSWTIRANPQRLTRISQHDATQEMPALRVDTCASALGAVLHEVAHTLYSPRTDGPLSKVTKDERAILGIYEDLYVNTQVVTKLPGFKNLGAYAYNWTNPNDLVTTLVEGVSGKDGWFNDAVRTISGDFMAYLNHKPDAQFPNPWQAELVERLRPIRDRLASGKPLSWEQRHTLIKRGVKIAYGVLHKHGLYDPPPPPEGGQGEQGEGGDGESQPGQGGSGQGQESEGDEQGKSKGSGGGEDVSQLGDDEGLEDVAPKQARDENATCEEQEHGESNAGQASSNTAVGQAIKQAVKNANAITEAKQLGGSSDPGDFGEVDGCFIIPATTSYPTDHYDKDRANMLARVFRTFSSARRGWLHGTDAGRLSARRLPGLLGGTTRNVFKARTEIRGVQGAVLILIDGSGSMGGKPYEQAALSARELFEAIGHNPDYAVHAWAYSGGGAQVDVTSAQYVKGQLMWPKCDGGSTPSWRAMTEGAKFLKRKYPQKKRVIVHMTDLGWNDSYIPEFTTYVESDPDLDYVTIGIEDGYSYGSGGGHDYQRMRVSKFRANDNIVGAVQDFAKKAFRG